MMYNTVNWTLIEITLKNDSDNNSYYRLLSAKDNERESCYYNSGIVDVQRLMGSYEIFGTSGAGYYCNFENEGVNENMKCKLNQLLEYNDKYECKVVAMKNIDMSLVGCNLPWSATSQWVI